LQRWGGEEENPYFRNAAHQFLTWHATVGKGSFTFVLAALSYFAYRLVKPLNENVASILACVLPLFYGWQMWQVANNNFFWIMRWVNL
jgi:hypothetical protein